MVDEKRGMYIPGDIIFYLDKILDHLKETEDLALMNKIKIIYKETREDRNTGAKREIYEIRRYI